MPVMAWLFLIGVPVVGIGTIVVLKGPAFFQPAPKEVVRADPNLRLKELESQVRGIGDEYNQFMKLSRAEDPSAKVKQESLSKRIDDWMIEWDTILDARRDAQGKLPDELRGYQEARTKINQIRIDLLKSSNF